MTKAIALILLIGSMSMMTLADGIERLEITHGDQKTADRGRLTIKFVETLEDSRCPPDVDCFWAGNAKIKFAVSKGKMAPTYVELNTGLDPTSVKLYGYTISLVGLTQNTPDNNKASNCPLIATLSVEE